MSSIFVVKATYEGKSGYLWHTTCDSKQECEDWLIYKYGKNWRKTNQRGWEIVELKIQEVK